MIKLSEPFRENLPENFHGSDREAIEQIYGIRKEDLVAFGANVNPLGLPPGLKETLAKNLDVIGSYPDREYKKLRLAIADYCGADADCILPGNGATELISLFLGSRRPKNAVLIEPTYSEYEREIVQNGGRCHHFVLSADTAFHFDLGALKDFLIRSQADLLILCNPNNPTSSLIKRPEMLEILRFGMRCGVEVIVDETYCEFTENPEAVSSIPLTDACPNLTVLRGVSKFFAAPGLRLGYAVTSNEELTSYILEHRDPWSINSLAELAGQYMFRDEAYIRASRELACRERARVTERLRRLPGLTIFEPYANFVLVRSDTPALSSELLFDEAVRRKMMIRNCSDFPSLDNRYFRFCFMLPEQNDRLLSCIEELLKK